MSVLGISCRVQRGEFEVVGVLAKGPRDSIGAREVFRHRSDPSEDWAQKLRSLTSHLETTLRQLAPDAVVIRALDWIRNRKEAITRMRYQIDGAILSVARRHVGVVQSHSGKELGALSDTKKAALEEEAAEVLGGDMKEAVAAAIGGLVLVEEA
jgi:Holliday junction resolvasome RuvABC endonuclease subunit